MSLLYTHKNVRILLSEHAKLKQKGLSEMSLLTVRFD